jgi:argininosuccinate lyase
LNCRSAREGVGRGLPSCQRFVAECGGLFREAHHVTGRIVALAAQRGVVLERRTLDEMQGVEPRITKQTFEVLGVDRSVKSRTSYGGTAPANVRREARAWLRRLGAG